MKRLIACAALLVLTAGAIGFGQVGVERPGSIQSQTDDVPVIMGGSPVSVVIGGRVESPRPSNRPPEPVLLRKRYLEQVQERARYMTAEELEVATKQVRRETNRIKTKLAEEREETLKAALRKQRTNQ